MDRRRSHPSGFELLVKLLRVPRSDLIDPDSLGHVFFEVRHHLFPYRNRGRLAKSGPELVHELGSASGQNSITCSIRAFRDSAIDLLKTQLGLICGKQDIISSGGRGYRFNDWITIRDTRKAETDPIEIEDTPASRRQRILELLGDGGKLRSTCIANHLGCSLKTVKRELETLRLAGRIEFIGPSKTGTYQLVGT